jgi:hypothetical protein
VNPQNTTIKALVKQFLVVYISDMLEKEIESYFVWTVEHAGGKTYKFKSPTQRGVSDRLACMPDGSTWFVELKAPKGKLLPLQVIFRDNVLDLHQKYALLNSKEKIDEWIATATISRRSG